jgi:uncharacterized protein
MKNIILSVVLLSTVRLLSAQSSFVGTWEGKLNAGMELRLVFHVSKDNGEFTGSMDCPDQGLKGVRASKLMLTSDSIYFEIDQFKAVYKGRLDNDSIIAGAFHQGIARPLKIKKVTKIAEIKRYQTPSPPFPYKVEELSYTNHDKSISYGATITLPGGPGPFPAVLLLTGSGQQNRDEEIAGHKPFAVIADHLTRQGFIVLRVDDRGMGKTTGEFRQATSKDFADDAIVSLNYLRGRKEVDQKRIGLIGHSEGGMLAQMIAAERNDINFIVLLAAPGVPNKKLLFDQNEAILKKTQLPENYIAAYLKLYQSILETSSSPAANLNEDVTSRVDSWISQTPDIIVRATTGITTEKSKVEFVNAFAAQIGNPWFNYFLNYDPQPVLKKIKSKVLALNGSEDVQVLADSNLSGIEVALTAAGGKNHTVKKLDGMNHLFQECKTCGLDEYPKLEQTISPIVLETISDWLVEQLR